MSLSRPFRFVVFDLDGTLVDSREDLATATNELIVEQGGAPLARERIVSMVGEGADMLIARAFAAAALDPVPPDALPRWLRLYDRVLLDTTRPYPGMREAIERLADAGIPLAVLTNKPCDPTVKILRGLDLARFFLRIVGGDESYGKKPRPSGLAALMAQAGAGPAETLMVGDSVIDLRTAREAGTASCLVKFGFGFARIPAGERLDDAIVVERASELPRIVLGTG